MGVFKHKDHEKSLLRVKQNRRRGKLRKGFNEKTAYEIMPSLVGSEMCIRDRAQRPRKKSFKS